MELKNRNVLVTGASQGLGRALARQFAGRGARVVGVARDAQRLSALVEELRGEGHRAWGIPADVGDKQAIHRIAGEAAALAGPIDILVHNASTLGPVPMPLLLDTECEDLEQVLQVNLMGPFRLTKVIAGAMATRGEGLVVHISSDAAADAYPRWGAYGVSKAAQDHLSRVFAAELAEAGVHFWSVDPGEMDTDMHRAALPEADPASLAAPAEVAARLVSAIAREGREHNGERLLASDLEEGRP